MLPKTVRIISGISAFTDILSEALRVITEHHLRKIALWPGNIAKLEHGLTLRVYVLSQDVGDFGKRSQGEEG